MVDLQRKPGWNIMHVSYGLFRHINTFLEDMPMTNMEARALLFMATAGGSVCQRDIELEYGLTAATVSELVQGMEAKGLVHREVDPADRRRKRVTIAEETHPSLEAMREYLVNMEETLTEVLTPERVGEFIDVLRQMAEIYPANGKMTGGAGVK